jgi:translocation and assembly module TamA
VITGLKRYSESVVRNFSTIEPGEPYDERELLRFLRRLNASGYFASAQAAIDPNPEHADAAGERRRDRGPPKRLEAGSGTRPTSNSAATCPTATSTSTVTACRW